MKEVVKRENSENKQLKEENNELQNQVTNLLANNAELTHQLTLSNARLRV